MVFEAFVASWVFVEWCGVGACGFGFGGAPVVSFSGDDGGGCLVGAVSGADECGDGGVGESVGWAVAECGHDAGGVPVGADGVDQVCDCSEVLFVILIFGMHR